MASALDYLGSSDRPMTFDEYWSSSTGQTESPNSIGNKFLNVFSGHVTSAKQAYDNYLTDYNNKQTFKREDTQIQRTMEDLKKAGINPLTAVMGNSITGNTTSGAKAYANVSSNKNEKSNFLSSALKVLALILLKK